jgi:PAS domain S-box-containing protein
MKAFDGTFLVTVSPVFDAEGRITKVIHVAKDITERKRAEEALRESEKQLQTLTDAMPDFVCFKDGDGRWLKVNDACIRLFRLEGVDYRGKKDSELAELDSFLRGTLLTCQETDARAWENSSLSHKEEMIPHPDGTVRVYDVIKVPVFHPCGERKGLVVLGRDITERKRAEEEQARLLEQIQEQAQQVQQIIDTMPEGVLLLDADEQVILANPVAEGNLATLAGAKVGDTLTRLGDRPLAELLARPPKGLWHEVKVDGPPPQTFEVIARPIETAPPSGEPPLPPEDVETAASEIQNQKSKIKSRAGWVMVVRDVTREREMQRYSQQQERLATVGQLAAGIAHDFNNIMATIVLYAHTLSRRIPALSPGNRERLATIKQQAMHATNLIQQILDFSRRAALKRQPLDLSPLLKEQVKMLARTLPESIELDLAYDPGEFTVNADPTRIQQVVMNLAAAPAGDGSGRMGAGDGVGHRDGYSARHSPAHL